MNKINVDIDFTNGTLNLSGIDLITGDYNSTEIDFTFDEEHEENTKTFEMKSPSDEVVFVNEIIDNKIILTALDENEHNVSLFQEEGYYIFEVSCYGSDSKLTSVYGKIPVNKEQVIIDGEIVEPYLPIFDQLMQDIDSKIEEVDSKIEEVDTKLETIDGKIEEVDTAIEETNNLNIDVSDKVDKDVTITLTKKDNTTKSVVISDGTSLQFVWQGTSLGIKTDDMQDYVFVDLQGIQGPIGPQGEPFRIKKTYPSVQAMNDDFNNMNYGDYVMIASSVEVQDNAKLYTRGETEWIFITDFSGATGIKGETGATPNIQIGSVTSGDTPSVTRTGTDENPILNFVLKTGSQGPQGPIGLTGNGIQSITKTSTTGLVDTYTILYTDNTTKTYEVSNGKGIVSIAKTSTSGSVDTYTITYTDGTTTTYDVTNGEVTQEQLDEVIAENDYLNNVINQLPKVSSTGDTITLNNTIEAKMKSKLSPSEMTQDGTPTPDNPQDIHTTTGDNVIRDEGKNLFDKNIMSNRIYAYIQNNTTWRYYYDSYSIRIPIKANTNYVVSANNPNETIFRAGITDSENTPTSENDITLYSTTRYTNTNTPIYLTTGENAKYIIVQLEQSTASTTLNSLMVNVGTTATDYEPYNGTDYPLTLGTLEYSKIGNYEDEFMIPSGNNLISSATRSGNVLFFNGATAQTDYIFKAGTYTLSYVNSNTTSVYVRTATTSATSLGSGSPQTITMTKDFNLWIYRSGMTDNETTQIMLNKGTTALPYEPYNNGKWYLKKNIGKVVLDTTLSSVGTTNFSNLYQIHANVLNISYLIGGFCDNFKFNNDSRITDNNNANFYLSNNQCALRLGNETARNRFYVKSTNFATANELKQYFNNNPTTLDYVLATPTYILLNETLQTQLTNIYNNMMSKKSQTNLSQVANDLPMVITASALLDLNTLVQ